MGAFSTFTDGFASYVTVVNIAVPLLFWVVWTIIYRLYLGPLAAFPGRKLAIITGWYEAYFECVQKGRYWVEIEKMHEEYGPIIRISPWELHVNDPDWNELYKVSAKVDKSHWFYSAAGGAKSAFGTADYERHRIRRKAQVGYFTQDAIAKFEPVLTQTISKLCKRLADTKGTGQVSNLSDAFRSQATDIVTEFAFEKSYNLLDQADFAASFHESVKAIFFLAHWNRHFLIILPLLESLPRWLVKALDPAGLEVLDFFDDAEAQAKAGVASYKPSTEKSIRRTNIVHQMLDAPSLSAEDKEEWRLALEVRVILGAGTETTGNTISVTAFHLLADPEKARRLKEEVNAAQREISAPLTAQQLATLPYLSAVVMEGQRMSTSISSRLPRINRRETMLYGDMIIPKNTLISMTQQLTHFNPTIFPDPHSFIPDRWLDPTNRKHLEKYMHPFGVGSRSCIGLHLATSVLYLTLSKLFSELDMQLVDTTEKDVTMFYDWFGPFPDSDRGMRVAVV